VKSYVTLLSNDEYFLYTVALWHSWKQVDSKYPLKVITTEKLSPWVFDKMKELNMDYMTVDTSDFDEIFDKAKIRKNWKEAFRKLTIFKLIDYEKMVFLDCDTIMVKNMDGLFDMPMLTCTSRYNSPGKDVKALLSGMFVFDPNMEDYNKILQVIKNVIDGKYIDNKELSLEAVNDEHVLSEVFKGRMHGLGCNWQWMPHVFNRCDVPWDTIYLVHIGAPKKKWFTEDRYINNNVSKPYSQFDYNMIYWYFNKLDEVVELYKLPFEITKKTENVDMSRVPVFIKPTKESFEDKSKSVVDLW